MNFKLNQLSSAFMAAAITLSALSFSTLLPGNLAWASGDHGHGHEEKEEHVPEGPHGGRLLHSGEFEVEITMVESGIPPEMRVYAYHKGEKLDPSEIKLELLLNRLGGKTDKISFVIEEDYLVSEQSVAEPHSFEVEVHAGFKGESFDWHYDNYTGRTEINDRLLKLSGIQTQQAGSKQLTFVDTLFGVVAPIADKQFSVNAPYAGVIERLHVSIGDSVEKGQIIATVRNSSTLQTYQVKSPASGQVTEQLLSLGDNTFNRALVRISDLSSVWIDLSAFPKSIDKLSLGQPVTIGDDHKDIDHNAENVSASARSTISYIAPTMTGGHIARVRAVIENEHGHWRPGMHIQADIETRTKRVPLAVRVDSLQTFMENPAVFVKHGNTFEVRMLKLGESDGAYVEVLAGLDSDSEYVTENSYLLKADIMKNAAKHVH
ncbi:cobalt-zinc-cadmium resistance protein (cation efflux system protein) [Shewanella sediminis HAW-EB3]|uniref:Cobalt-zinc-cadmium resistance protein (Cation efflux system protein) n=1 Tax=Shewanella sediminis (strain HAW-EB3) TaxID=425104 RepID=A8G050_SHESH|nr:efflux RND transporter periplasmic adaptor subunit [Shewanella sediminis]ABV38473.1 cobalt-zinc-cadmium resistance protein (cation efflux system protein) [Shewanella sediminis HAW-EB3]